MILAVPDVVRVTIAVAIFGLFLSVWVIVVWSLWLRRKSRDLVIQQRLGHQGAPGDSRVLRLWHDQGVSGTVVPIGAGPGLAVWLERKRLRLGFEASLGRLGLAVVGFTSLSCLVGLLLTKSVLISFGCGIACLAVLWMFVQGLVKRRDALFDKQLVDAMGLAARSLRAGHPLTGAIQLMADEIPRPVGDTFARVCQEIELGASMDEALMRVARESSSEDLNIFATSVAIQLRSGGNLAEMMERLALVIRDRIRLNRRVRVLTTDARMSKNFLLALPPGLMLLMSIASPEYVQPLFERDGGKMMLAVGGTSLLLGALVMRRMISVRY